MSARDALPIHQMRPTTPPRGRGRPAGAARQAVETVLRTATRDRPLDVAQIAARCGVSVTLTRTHVCHMVSRGTAHNIQRGARYALYAWGPEPGSAPIASHARRDPGTYDGRELQPYTGRPGAMDAFALPSLQNGVRVPRKAPLIIAAAGGMRMASRGPSAREE